jgi:hypothetical protein
MKDIIAIGLRTVICFVLFAGLQFIIPYYFLVVAGILAGLYLWCTGEDRVLGIGFLIGTVLFGIFAFLYGTV